MLTGSPDKRPVQVGEHFVSALEEQGAQVVGAGEHGLDRLERYPVVLAALPGREQPPRDRGALAARCVAHAVQLDPLR